MPPIIESALRPKKLSSINLATKRPKAIAMASLGIRMVRPVFRTLGTVLRSIEAPTNSKTMPTIAGAPLATAVVKLPISRT